MAEQIREIRYLLLAAGVSELLNFDSSSHGFAQRRVGVVGFILHVF